MTKIANKNEYVNCKWNCWIWIVKIWSSVKFLLADKITINYELNNCDHRLNELVFGFFISSDLFVSYDTLKSDVHHVHYGIPKKNYSIYENRQWEKCIALSGYLSPLSALIQIVTDQIEFTEK